MRHNSLAFFFELNKSKGTLLLPYGPSGDGELGWFMKEVSMNALNKDKTTLNKV